MLNRRLNIESRLEHYYKDKNQWVALRIYATQTACPIDICVSVHISSLVGAFNQEKV